VRPLHIIGTGMLYAYFTDLKTNALNSSLNADENEA
jgi:hypothetical protein